MGDQLSNDDRSRTYEKWEIKELVDSKLKVALKEYDDGLQKALVLMFIIQLSPYKSAYNVLKFVVVAVALLVIGTVYQFLIGLANSGVAK